MDEVKLVKDSEERNRDGNVHEHLSFQAEKYGNQQVEDKEDVD